MHTGSDDRHGYLLEVCAADLDSVVAAEAGGADRIEFCDNLGEGGTTPSLGNFLIARQLTVLPIRVLIRARPGDFTFSEPEVAAMKGDIMLLRDIGADGFVLGALTAGGDIDRHVMEMLLEAAGGLPWTFHRAIDFCTDPFAALETAIALGADTILTSGQASSASLGAGLIRTLVQRASGRISIMAGAGITDENIDAIMQTTGCRAFHFSARKSYPNALLSHTSATLNATRIQPDGLRKSTDAEVVRRARERLLQSTQSI
jgi:copper homeostasis protein